jgi:hypothetical protein
MVSCAATALMLLVAAASAASAASAARPVQQQSPADVGVTFKPVSLGDGSQRLLTRGYFTAKGGALNALSRPTLLALKRSSRFRGSVESFAAHLDKEKDLVSAPRRWAESSAAAQLAIARRRPPASRSVGGSSGDAPPACSTIVGCPAAAAAEMPVGDAWVMHGQPVQPRETRAAPQF